MTLKLQLQKTDDHLSLIRLLIVEVILVIYFLKKQTTILKRGIFFQILLKVSFTASIIYTYKAFLKVCSILCTTTGRPLGISDWCSLFEHLGFQAIWLLVFGSLGFPGFRLLGLWTIVLSSGQAKITVSADISSISESRQTPLVCLIPL